MTKKTIAPETLVPMDLFADDFSLRVELAYAREDNLLFGERLYREDARLWMHEDLASIVLLASKIVNQEHGLHMILHDSLRTTDAQALMLETRRAIDNPHWLKEPALLSSPGSGGHPRGMAVDISLETEDGELLDMGTAFDFLSEDPAPESNSAHREYHHSDLVTRNHEILDTAMLEAAQILGIELLPLPEEWWDFRLPAAISNQYAPLSDADLPPQMRMTETPVSNDLQNLPEAHFTALKQTLTSDIESVLKRPDQSIAGKPKTVSG